MTVDEGAATVLAATLALGAAAVTAFVSYHLARLKVTQELEIAFDRELHAHRVAAYGLLWSRLQPLAKYPDLRCMAGDEIRHLSRALTSWYYHDGGLFLSHFARERYFDLQDGLKLTIADMPPSIVRRVADADPGASEALRQYLERPRGWDCPDELLALVRDRRDAAEDRLSLIEMTALRDLGSRLRTTLADDAMTRERSLVAQPPGSAT